MEMTESRGKSGKSISYYKNSNVRHRELESSKSVPSICLLCIGQCKSCGKLHSYCGRKTYKLIAWQELL